MPTVQSHDLESEYNTAMRIYYVRICLHIFAV